MLEIEARGLVWGQPPLSRRASMVARLPSPRGAPGSNWLAGWPACSAACSSSPAIARRRVSRAFSGSAVRLIGLGEVVKADAGNRNIAIRIGDRFLQIADRGGRDPALVEHPTERVCHSGGVGQGRLGVLREIQGAIEIFAGLSVDVGEVVLRIGQVRAVLDRVFVALDRLVLCTAERIEGSEEVVEVRILGARFDRVFVGGDRLVEPPGLREESRELFVTGRVRRVEFDRLLEGRLGVIAAGCPSARRDPRAFAT